MTKKQPHRNRRTNIHIWILFLIGIIVFLASSCTPTNGCRATRHMAGYGWIKCRETGLVMVTDKDGSIVCSYYESPSK